MGEIPVLGIYLRAMQTCVYKRTSRRMFIGVLIIIAKNRKQTKCSSTDVMGYSSNGLLLSNKGTKLLIHEATKVDLPI